MTEENGCRQYHTLDLMHETYYIPQLVTLLAIEDDQSL